MRENKIGPIVLVAVAWVTLLVYVLCGGSQLATAQKDAGKRSGRLDGDRQAHGGALKREVPKKDMAYVWPLPSHGHQTVVVLGVVDGTTVDAAFLVPVRLKLAGVAEAPAPDTRDGKKAREALEQLLSGRPRTAQLFGVGQGGIMADFWIDAAKGDGQWVSAALITNGTLKEKK